jgi:hypothetical protein
MKRILTEMSIPKSLGFTGRSGIIRQVLDVCYQKKRRKKI